MWPGVSPVPVQMWPDGAGAACRRTRGRASPSEGGRGARCLKTTRCMGTDTMTEGMPCHMGQIPASVAAASQRLSAEIATKLQNLRAVMPRWCPYLRILSALICLRSPQPLWVRALGSLLLLYDSHSCDGGLGPRGVGPYSPLGAAEVEAAIACSESNFGSSCGAAPIFPHHPCPCSRGSSALPSRLSFLRVQHFRSVMCVRYPAAGAAICACARVCASVRGR